MTFSTLSFALAALGLATAASAQIGPITDLDIINAEVNLDGFPRQAVLAGGTFPGPTISGNKGDNFQINVHNSLTNETMDKTTTIHWHGIFQHHTNWADGPAFVTQCPIASGNSFLYDFDVPDQAGTFWYHSHLGTQYCDGLRGPFVVYDPEDPHKDLYDVDDETTIITLADWYHEAAALITPPADPDSVLINGRGRQANDTIPPLTVINVEHGKRRYRIRLISISCDPYFNFTIDGHNFTIIEADGENTVPLPGIDEIQIFAAQRYSFILDASQPIDNYWIHVIPEQVGGNGSVPTPPGLAVLHYIGAPEVDPKANATEVPTPENPLFEPNLHALDGPAPGDLDPDCAECDLVLNFSFTAPRFYVNNVTFVNPTVPVLLQILHGNYTAQDLMPEGSVYVLPRNKTIQITMPGGVLNITHPLHLHGHSFSVIRSAGSNVTNLQNPVRRDTVSIGSADTDEVTIRFTTDNPGPWFLHCHIDFHLAAGFAVVMAEDPTDVASYVAPVPRKFGSCTTLQPY
ncbi:laccase [Fomitopsis serialis]|uniref:laccase n=1 Tax=Fomitopsis serialis TaxID=139415 RepID=UPI0020080D39|nr:laccase [Neoantrodia serialis]KAH9926907.1 laccase [Neoantrodia serialis]